MWLLDLPTVVQHLISHNQWNQCLWSDTHLFLFPPILPQFLLSFPYHLCYIYPFLVMCRTSLFWFSSIINLSKSKFCWSVQFWLGGGCGGAEGHWHSLTLGFNLSRNKKQRMDNHLPTFAFCSLRSFYVGNAAPILWWVSSLYPAKCGAFFVSLFCCLFSLLVI